MAVKKAEKSKTKHLVIVESPTKAGTINKFLGKDYHVEASFGHVRDLPKSKMGVDVANDFVPQYIIPSKAKKTVNKLKKAAEGMQTIFLAADPDREGEAISWHLAAIFNGSKADIKRVEFNELTKEAVCRSFEHPREIDENLVNAQQARRILDRVVGYELSPLLWKKVQRGLSAGRVQSVALRIIVEREREIRAFVPEEYWSLHAELSSKRPEQQSKIFTAKLVKIGKEKAEIHREDEMLGVKNALTNAEFRVLSVQKKERQRKAQAPYTTSKLQQEAYNRLGFSAVKTMKVAQSLYEGVDLGKDGGPVGLITYMRTDSVNIADVARKEASQYIYEKFGSEYYPQTPNMYKSKKGAQEAHEAIRPSSAYREPEKIKSHLNEEQYKLYDLIWRKFVSSQMTPARDLVTSIDIQAGTEYFFKASGTKNIFPGFSAVFGDFQKNVEKKENEDKKEEADESGDVNDDFPELEYNELLNLHQLTGNQHFTKPPPRFNDASLVKILEEKGIGRPSTYAPTISTLVYRNYAERKGGALMPTELADTVIDLLVNHFPVILDVEFTARMEEDLDLIEEGKADWVKILKEFHEPFEKQLVEAREKMKDMKKPVVETDEKCEKCGKTMVIRWGRFGKFIACSGFPECRNTKAISTGVPCPKENCGGSLVPRRSKGNRKFFGCSKYPACDYIANQLPKSDSSESSPVPSSAESGEKPSTDGHQSKASTEKIQ